MTCELDHFFICTAAGAPEAESLIQFGLTESEPNVHRGQGTANRRFFFRNAMLELLWVHDPQEAQSEPIRPTHLWQRWSGRTGGTCPFGLCFRPTGQGARKPPFAAWEYRPSYQTEPLSFLIAANADTLTEPMLCYLAFGRRPDALPQGQRQRLDHTAGMREITRLHLVSPYAGMVSTELRAIVNSGLGSLGAGAKYLLEIGFDGEPQGETADFQPALPLIFYW